MLAVLCVLCARMRAVLCVLCARMQAVLCMLCALQPAMQQSPLCCWACPRLRQQRGAPWICAVTSHAWKICTARWVCKGEHMEACVCGPPIRSEGQLKHQRTEWQLHLHHFHLPHTAMSHQTAHARALPSADTPLARPSLQQLTAVVIPVYHTLAYQVSHVFSPHCLASRCRT